MKKIFFMLFFLAIGMTATFAAKLPSDRQKVKLELNSLDRECCTVSVVHPDGVIISVTACAGWFLSNSAAAMTRACDKANDALEEFTN